MVVHLPQHEVVRFRVERAIVGLALAGLAGPELSGFLSPVRVAHPELLDRHSLVVGGQLAKPAEPAEAAAEPLDERLDEPTPAAATHTLSEVRQARATRGRQEPHHRWRLPAG